MTNCLICDRDAGHAYGCHHCLDDLRRWLRDLEDYAAVIMSTMAPASSPSVGSIGSAFGSRPPVSIEKVTFLDYRSGAGAAVWRLRDPRDMDDEPIRSLPGSIHGLACWLREESGVQEPGKWTLVSELHYLITRVDSCAYSQWVTELHEDIRELHAQARRLAKDSARPISGCLNVGCDGVVFWDIREENGKRVDQARCANRACGRIYTGLDLVRLGAAQEAG